MPSVTVTGAGGDFVVVNYDNMSYVDNIKSLNGGSDTVAGAVLTTAGGLTILPGSVNIGIGTLDDPTGTGLGAVTVDDRSTAANQLVLTGVGTTMNFYTNVVGGGTIVAGNGNDTISTGDGNWLVYTGDATSGSQVFTGAGSDTVVMGAADTVVAGSGSTTVFGAATSGGLVTGGAGYLTYAAGSGDSTVVAGSGTTYGFGSSATTVFDLNSGIAVLVGGEGGTMSVVGGSGFSEYFGNDNSTVDYFGSSENNLFVAGTGNETLNAAGSTGDNVFYAGSGGDSITAGSGDDILFGGSGDSTLTGGSGTNVFAFVDQGTSSAMDKVIDFTSTSILELIGGVSIDSQDTSSGSDVVTLSDGTMVTFTGLSSSISDSQIFHF